VDIVWFKHPLEFFHDEQSPIHFYDIYFQDDGGHSPRYAPYSPNSGFYYVRHNPRTQHFLTSLLMGGDLVLKTNSHQQAMTAVLAEHASLYGLRVKVLSRNEDDFPGGMFCGRNSFFACLKVRISSRHLVFLILLKVSTIIVKRANGCGHFFRERNPLTCSM
jgi:hypothetical protein